MRIDSATAAMLLWLLVWVSKPAALPLDEAAMLLPNLGARIGYSLLHGFVWLCLEIVEVFRRRAAEEHGRFANHKIRFISDNMLAPSTDLILVSLTLGVRRRHHSSLVSLSSSSSSSSSSCFFFFFFVNP